MKCVSFTVNVCICDMLFLTCTEHTSTMSPVSESQDYDCQHQNKGIDQIRNSRDDVCLQLKAKRLRYMYRLPKTYAHVKCSSSHA